MFEAKWFAPSDEKLCFKIPVSNPSGDIYTLAFGPSGTMESLDDGFFMLSGGTLKRGNPTSGYSGQLNTLNDESCAADLEVVGDYAYFSLTKAQGSCWKALPTGETYIFPVKTSNTASQHSITPKGAKCNLFSASGCAAKTTGITRLEKQTHGSLMIVAWLLLSTTGIFTGRFMRNVLGKKGVWFKIHMYSQMGAVILTLAGYVYITLRVRDVRGKSQVFEEDIDDGNPHRMMGFTVFILSLVQLCLGLARNLISGKPQNKNDPNDHGPNRWLFQLLHITIGYTSWILGIISVWYGIELLGGNDANSDAAVDSTYVTILAIYVGFMAIAFVVLELMKMSGDKSDKLGPPPSEQIWNPAPALFFSCGIAAATPLMIAVNKKKESD
jgi:hypothetical protein